MTPCDFSKISNEEVLLTAKLELFLPAINATLTKLDRDAAWLVARNASDAAWLELKRRGVDMYKLRDAIDSISGGWPNDNHDREWVVRRAIDLVS